MFLYKNSPHYEELPNTIINGQRWYTTPHGDFPSITTVLGDEEKKWLNDWRESLGDEKATKEQKRCSERGTAIHLMVEKYLKNEINITKDQTKENIYLFNKLIYTLDKIQNIRAQEIPMYSKMLKIAGRCDIVAEFDGILSIIDLKTSTKLKKRDMIKDYFLQCCGYSYMYSELFEEFPKQIVVIIATENGIYPLVFKCNMINHINDLIIKIDSFYDKYIK